jgi:hypothetical protein
MDSKVWGTLFWRVFESIAYNARQPPNAVISFFSLFQYLLPCKYCRASFKEFSSPKLVKQTNASTFVYQVHELVNKKLNKPPFPFEVYKKRLEAFQAPLAPADLNNFLLVMIANFDHNPMPEQEMAWRKMWAVLPRMISSVLPENAQNIAKCPLPTNVKLSTSVLKRVLICSRPSLDRVMVMRVK